ncbi:PREDICTED: N66 matrix protein-like, partial [Rhagoletis zephyria]|uniref:N66 matrix protein-like n=1 Tax=Rhagoletis zephyria TaxID=28612 RepID=UPI0008117E11
MLNVVLVDVAGKSGCYEGGGGFTASECYASQGVCRPWGDDVSVATHDAALISKDDNKAAMTVAGMQWEQVTQLHRQRGSCGKKIDEPAAIEDADCQTVNVKARASHYCGYKFNNNGDANANGIGNGHGNGNDKINGNGNLKDNGNLNGNGNYNGNGYGNDNGNPNGNGNYNDNDFIKGIGIDHGHGRGNDNGKVIGNGNGQGNGNSNGHGHGNVRVIGNSNGNGN